MFPLLFFGTFYLWHLGQPPTHSSLSRCSMRGATVKGISPQWQGISPGDVHMLCKCVCVCICVRLPVCTLPGDSQSCRLRRKNKVDSEYLSNKSSKMFGFMRLSLCLCACVCVKGLGGLRCHLFQSNPGSLSAEEEASRDLPSLLISCILLFFKAGVISTSWWLSGYRPFLTADILTCHSRKSTGVNNNISDTSIPSQNSSDSICSCDSEPARTILGPELKQLNGIQPWIL